MDVVLYVLGQLLLVAGVVVGLVLASFLAIFLFVRKKELPESMRRADNGPNGSEEG